MATIEKVYDIKKGLDRTLLSEHSKGLKWTRCDYEFWPPPSRMADWVRWRSQPSVLSYNCVRNAECAQQTPLVTLNALHLWLDVMELAFESGESTKMFSFESKWEDERKRDSWLGEQE